MKTIILVLTCLFLFNCLRNSSTSLDSTGDIEVSVQLNRIGILSKKSALTKTIDLSSIIITVFNASGDSVSDTTTDVSSSSEQYSVNFFSLATEQTWYIQAIIVDQNAVEIYSGMDSVFLAENRSESVFLNLFPQFSEFSIQIYPLPDSASTLTLIIDDTVTIDTSVSELAEGTSVSLFYDYLSCSPHGIEHTIEVAIRGQKFGNDTVLYRGDTTVTVYSSQLANLMFLINYVGPTSTNEFQLNAKVFLNEVGSLNGIGIVDTAGVGNLYLFQDTLQIISHDLTVSRSSTFHGQFRWGQLDSNEVVLFYQIRNSENRYFDTYITSFQPNSSMNITEVIPSGVIPGDDYYLLLVVLDKNELWDVAFKYLAGNEFITIY